MMDLWRNWRNMRNNIHYHRKRQNENGENKLNHMDMMTTVTDTIRRKEPRNHSNGYSDTNREEKIHNWTRQNKE